MENQEQLELLNALKEKYNTMKTQIHGERLEKISKLDSEIAQKEREYSMLLKQSQLTEAKIENTETMSKQREWQKITDILDGKA